jgi:hypothetical protein
LEGVQSGSGSFLKLWCKTGLLGRFNRPQAVRSQRGGLTAQGRRSNRPGQSEQVFALCCIPMLHRCIGSGGVCFGSGGACICAGGSSLCCSRFGLVACALSLSMVLPWMCRAVTLA